MASGLQCFGCGVQFGIFKREHSCKNCGHIFCSACTSQSIVIPNQGSSKHKVCFKCYKILTSPPDTQNKRKQNDLNKIPEPRIFTNRSLPLNQTVPNISVTTQGVEKGPSLDPDEQIRQRLQKLKQDHQKDACTSVTDEEIGRRFEDLAGRKPITQQKSNINAFVPKKTEQEEISDLLNQVTDECRLEDDLNTGNDSPMPNGETCSTSNETTRDDEVQSLILKTIGDCKNEKYNEKEIEDRLANLKGIDSSVYRNPVPCDIDSDDEEAYNARYLQKVLGEALLDDKTKAMGYDISEKKEKPSNAQNTQNIKGKSRNIVDAAPSNTPSSIFSKEYEADSDDEELPWCCICNANAVLRCHGCDDDLYCKRCFREGHRDEDPEEHTVSAYRPKTKKS